MPRSLLALVLVLLATAGVAVSCGGDGGGKGPTLGARTSLVALVQHADEICTRGQQDADALRQSTDPAARGKAAAAEVDATIAVLNRQIDGFGALRGPAATDAPLRQAVRQLRRAAAGLAALRAVIVKRYLTVNEAVRDQTALVNRINGASAKASDALVTLNFLSCVGVAQG